MSYIGTEISVVAQKPAAEDQSGYESLSTTVIGKVVSSSEMGDQHQDQSSTLLKDGRTKHANGAADGGDINVTIDGEDYTDAGLAIIEEANGTNVEHSFKFEGPEQTRYVYGVVRNLRTNTFDTQTKSGLTFTISVNSGITRVAAD